MINFCFMLCKETKFLFEICCVDIQNKWNGDVQCSNVVVSFVKFCFEKVMDLCRIVALFCLLVYPGLL